MKLFISSLSNINSNPSFILPENGVYVYLLTGQSNADGVAANSDASTAEKLINNNILIWKNSANNFQPLEIGVNNESTSLSTHGQELMIKNTWESNFNKPLYIIKYAVGGTKIDYHITGGSVYNTFKSYVSNGINKLLSDGKRPFIVSLGFSQGENDAVLQTDTDLYESKLITWHNLWRTNLGTNNIPFNLVGLHIVTDGSDADEMARRIQINNIFSTREAEDSFVYYINTDGVPTLDKSHYNYIGFKNFIVPELIQNIKSSTPVEITSVV